MYNSPIELIYGNMETQIRDEMDKQIFGAVQKVGIHVDKEELIKALAYDRGQYNQGYKDGYKEAKRQCADALDAVVLLAKATREG